MSLRPVKAAPNPAAAAATGAPLRTVAPSPYNDRRHLTPQQYEDHDGGPWNDTPKMVPQFVPVPNKWVVAPALGAKAPAMAIFPKRNSNKISFASDVHLQFATVWTPIVARFSQIFLVGEPPRALAPPPPQTSHRHRSLTQPPPQIQTWTRRATCPRRTNNRHRRLLR